MSWFQENPTPSLELMSLAGATPRIRRHRHWRWRLTVGRCSGGEWAFATLRCSTSRKLPWQVAKARLGGRAEQVEWVVADVTTWEPRQAYDLWHDRAAFHFLTEERDRKAYVARLVKAVKPGGHAIIATFAPDGPERCSGLPVMRYDAESLGRSLEAPSNWSKPAATNI